MLKEKHSQTFCQNKRRFFANIDELQFESQHTGFIFHYMASVEDRNIVEWCEKLSSLPQHPLQDRSDAGAVPALG
jgi:hypothetical protein